MEKTNQEKIPVLNEKQQDALRVYLESRLYQYGVRGYELVYEETPKYTYGAILSQELSLKNLGIFGLALNKCKFVADIWRNKESEDGVIYITTNLRYEHVTGGSNGCELGVRARITADGKIVETYN